MPVYEYKCTKCGYRFALLEAMDAPKSDRECPVCGSTDTNRIISNFATKNDSGDNKDNCKSGCG